MKLSENESALLGLLELNPELPIKSIRRQLGIREHTVRYLIKKLEERRVISKIPLVNLHQIGLITFNVFFSLSAQKKEPRIALMNYLKLAKEVVWIGEFGGEFQYGIAIAHKSASRVSSLLKEIATKFPNAFFEKELSLQNSCAIFPRRYISSSARKAKMLNPVLEGNVHGTTTEIDELDESILAKLADDGSASHRQIAESLAVAPSTVDLRVKNLIKNKVILGYIYAVDPGQYGYQQFKLLIYVKGLHPDLTKMLSNFCTEQRNVTSLIECTGAWDYEIGLDVSNPELVSIMVQELYERFGTFINTIKTLTRFRDTKVRWYPGKQL